MIRNARVETKSALCLAVEFEIWQAIVEYSLSAIMKIKLSF